MGLRPITVRTHHQQPCNTAGICEPAFIEIRHTFGPNRKSVYKVVETSENGTSFLVPVTEGFFRVGYPLEYSLIMPDLTKTVWFGVVRYYHPYTDDKGRAFFKVGVENHPDGSRRTRRFQIRPPSNDFASRTEQAIYFSHGDREYQFPIVDISRYSAAFYPLEEQELGLTVSTALDGVVIVYGVNRVFEGTVVVTRREHLPLESRYRIVIEPRSAMFNVELNEAEENLSSVSRSVEHLIVTSKRHRDIDSEFKSRVSDMRLFLEEYRRILDMPTDRSLSLDSRDPEFLEELSRSFYPELSRYMEEFDDVVEALSLLESEHGLYKSYVQSNFHSLLMTAPFCHRTYYKPLGYPGDFEMLRMIEEAAYRGPSLFSKLVHHAMLQTPLCRANRSRSELFAKKIAAFVARSDQERVYLLSVASGPAAEIQHILEQYPELGDRIHVTLLDQELEALKYCQDNIYMKRILNNCEIQVDLVHERIGTFFKSAALKEALVPQFDMVYIPGLFDYFDDRSCRFCLENAASILKPKGEILVSNFAEKGHKQRAFFEHALEWYMVYRNAEQMAALGESLPLPVDISVENDISGTVRLLELKPGDEW